ncbi:hypothetical protein [Marinospirillum insulare]|uniref:Uncharacterized protein n=1 Tax=Marinospirillum insulare TaxID=217169 RepID=A0ABQ5ZWG2_9GAMM|nr:hypothetical protein [Marinospirillum insulare]GLR64506.1 hypothetical protein GCM10007878_19440 [Marinospirillum insulare]
MAMVSDKEFHDALKRITNIQLPESNPKLLPSPIILYPPTVEDELNWTVSTSDFFDPNYPNEPQQLPFTFIKISDDEDEGINNFDPQSLDEEVELSLNESRYWLNRVEKLVPNDYGRLTRVERLTLIKFLKDKLASNNSSDFLAAGLIGLMYFTGSNLEDLWEAKLGFGGDFEQDGTYRRLIKRPKNSFQPNDEQQKFFQPVASQLLLPLPEPIASWLKLLLQNDSSSFEQLLKLSLEDVKNLVYPELGDLRKQTRLFRLRSERIPTALGLEATLIFRDPLITYLIAGRKTQSPPMLSYYAVHSVECLIDYYKQVTGSMSEVTC